MTRTVSCFSKHCWGFQISLESVEFKTFAFTCNVIDNLGDAVPFAAAIQQNGVAVSKNVNIGGKDVKQISTAIVNNDIDNGLSKLGDVKKIDGDNIIQQNGLAVSKNFNLGGKDVDQKSLAVVDNDVDLGSKKGDDKIFGKIYGRRML